jgi:hypothetical protein
MERSSRGTSAVVSTVILMSLTVILVVSLYFWNFTFTKERGQEPIVAEISARTSDSLCSNGQITIKNTGTVTISYLGELHTTHGTYNKCVFDPPHTNIKPGDSATCQMMAGNQEGTFSGTITLYGADIKPTQAYCD